MNSYAKTASFGVLHFIIPILEGYDIIPPQNDQFRPYPICTSPPIALCRRPDSLLRHPISPADWIPSL